MPPMRSSTFRLGMWGESRVAQTLVGYGREVIRNPHSKHFDMLVDGWRVDAKTSEAITVPGRKHPRWYMKTPLCQSPYVDFYVGYFSNFNDKHGTFILIPSPTGVSGFTFTKTSLVKKFPTVMDDFSRFAKGDYGQGPHSPTHEVPAHGNREEIDKLPAIGGNAHAD